MLTWPKLLAPAVHTRPSLPTRIEWFLPNAADTNLVPATAPRSTGLILSGAFSETKSTPDTPSAESWFRPNSHAAPWLSSAMQWLATQEVCIETILTLFRERRICGSRRSGWLCTCKPRTRCNKGEDGDRPSQDSQNECGNVHEY